MMRNLLLLLFSILIQNTIAQDKRILINGTVKNSFLKAVKSTHIINLTTKEGTVSNDNGMFTIHVRKGDWLLISNVQYKQKKIKITSKTIEEKAIQVHLFAVVNELEEVFLKKKMKGSLELDRINKPKDTVPKSSLISLKEIAKMDLSNVNMGESKKPPNSRFLTDPTTKFGGLGGGVGIPDKSSIRRRALLKRLKFKKDFPHLLKKQFGEKFFFKTLKIPEDKYFHFLEYCNTLGIEKLYKDGKILQLLKLLKTESKSYLVIINKN